MIFPLYATLFLAGFFCTLWTGFVLFLVPCAALLAWETLNWRKIIVEKGVPLSRLSIMIAVLRSYLSFVCHLCAFGSRYYLIWAVVLVFLWQTASAVIFLLHLVTAVVDYIIKRPCLNFLSFLFFFTLEQLSYQAGVWYGCVRERDFGSINPKVVWSGASAEVSK
ncbi:conserved domain protein [delta proteobacterium NaphS2]|nr:conserved domain protein [delta proteobacterium NaphS2]